MNETVLAILLIILAVIVMALSVMMILTRPGGKKKKNTALRENEVQVPVGGHEMIISHAQHIGARASQQDAYGFTADDHALVVALCDGMGGMAMGKEASRLATDILLDVSRRDYANAAESLAVAMNEANHAVYQLCQGTGGTTAVLARLDQSGLSYAAAGDSRIYLYRARTLTQLGRDHVLYYDLIRSGAATPTQANAHPESAHLTSYLGQELLTRVNATDSAIPLLSGDAVLIISDGVNKTVQENVLSAALAEGANASDIVAKALFAQNPKQDNMTCVLVRVL